MSKLLDLPRTRNFDPLEVVHRVSTFPASDRRMLDIVPIAMGYLQALRDGISEAAGRDIRLTITSGYRDLAFNRSIGSKDTSYHVWRWQNGLPVWAVDLTSPDADALDLYAMLKDRVRGETYVHRRFGFVHLAPVGPDQEWIQA